VSQTSASAADLVATDPVDPGPRPSPPGTTATAFDSFDLPEAVRAGIRDAGFTQCTPIQEKVLPVSLRGRDVAGQAQTGTGKTAAFLVTVFTKLVRAARPHQPAAPRALVVAPTRELVVQIAADARVLGRHTGLTVQAVYGGVDYRKQRDALGDGVDLLIGTPGRLIDYLKQRAYSLRRTEIVVIDEADRMFDMGFIRDLRFLLRRLPPYSERQSMLFSATLSYDVLELAYEHMNDPAHLSVSAERVSPEKIDHLVYHVGAHEKARLLIGLLRYEAGDRVLVFTNMRRSAGDVVGILEANGIVAASITGDMDQRHRLLILERFKTGDLPVLVATDVASRGLHIEGVTHVVNYDLPQDPEDYVHRTGRTARAGAEGKALSLVCEYDVEALAPIEDLLGFKLPHTFPDDTLLPAITVPRFRRDGSRPSGGDGPRRHTPRPDSRSRTGDARPTPAHGQASRSAGPAYASAGGGGASAAAGPGGRRRRRRGRRGGPHPQPNG
jgi:ATP-dependent RNA helicase RhlB